MNELQLKTMLSVAEENLALDCRKTMTYVFLATKYLDQFEKLQRQQILKFILSRILALKNEMPYRIYTLFYKIVDNPQWCVHPKILGLLKVLAESCKMDCERFDLMKTWADIDDMVTKQLTMPHDPTAIAVTDVVEGKTICPAISELNLFAPWEEIEENLERKEAYHERMRKVVLSLKDYEFETEDVEMIETFFPFPE